MGTTATIGAPSKYDPSINADVAEMALAGATDAEIAQALGIERVTLYRWKHRYPAFGYALKRAKEACDDRIAETLYDKASTGDVTSMIFWLKNRRPQEWRDSQSSGSALTLSVSGAAAVRLVEQLTSTLSAPDQPPMIDAKPDDEDLTAVVR